MGKGGDAPERAEAEPQWNGVGHANDAWTFNFTAQETDSDSNTATTPGSITVSCVAGLAPHVLNPTYHTGTFTGLF